MRCHETRALSSAYSDSELDVKTSFDIEQHLGICPACARHFDAERRVDARIDAALRSSTKDELLWKRIEAQLGQPEQLPQPAAEASPRRRPWIIAALTIAACVVFTMTWFAFPVETSPDITAVAVDHAKFIAGNMPAQFIDQPPADITDRAGGRLGPEAFSIIPPESAFVSEGKRLCHLEGAPVAWIMGKSGDQPTSIIVMREAELHRFPAIQKRLNQGHPIACFEAGGFHLGARRVGDHIVTAIADLPRPQIEALLASVTIPR